MRKLKQSVAGILLIVLIPGCITSNSFIKQYESLSADYDSGKITEQEFRNSYDKLKIKAETYHRNQAISNLQTMQVLGVFASGISRSYQQMHTENAKRQQEFLNNLQVQRWKSSTSHTTCRRDPITGNITCDTVSY